MRGGMCGVDVGFPGCVCVRMNMCECVCVCRGMPVHSEAGGCVHWYNFGVASLSFFLFPVVVLCVNVCLCAHVWGLGCTQ